MSDSVDPIAEILARWKSMQDRPDAPSLEELCRDHPSLAGEIRSRFAALEELGAHLRRGAVDESPERLHLVREERYARFRPVGEGGMGIVYWAVDTELNREVAFKIVRPGTSSAKAATPPAPLEVTPPAKDTPASAAFATLKARFLQEAWVTAGMSHPGIVPVYELGRTPEGIPYYTMRFVRGNRTLAREIDETKGRPWEERLTLLEPFLKVCDTLSYAHAQGVVHRDVKPDNVALGEFGEVVVLDWGLAKIKDRADVVGDAWQDRVREFRETSDLRTLASALGTPGYMSPEAALGRVAEVDATSDVYSLGAILYRILAGRLPFQFDTFVDLVKQLLAGSPPSPASIDPTVPAELSDLCLRALSKNREARPQSAEALAREIRDWQTRSTLDREADALVRDAKGALDTSATLRGAAAAAETDRAAAIVARATSLRPDDAATAAVAQEIARRREATVAERERAARRRTLKRAAVAATAAAAVAAIAVAALIESERRETAQARDVATTERDAKTAALAGESAARRRATAYALAQASAEPLAENPQLALLLARESVRVESTPDGISRLHDALAASKERVRFLGDRSDGAPSFGGVFLGDGGRVAGADRDGAVYIWDLNGTIVSRLAGHTGRLLVMTASSDRSRFATGSMDRTARIWSADGTPLASMKHGGVVRVVRFDRAGGRVVTVDGRAGLGEKPGTMRDSRARLFDATGRKLAEIGGDDDLVWTADVSPDGRLVATGTMGGAVDVWTDAGASVRSLRASSAQVVDVRFAPDGGALLAVGADGNVTAWTVAGEKTLEFAVGMGQGPKQSAGAWFSSDGARVVAWGSDGQVQSRALSGGTPDVFPMDRRQRALQMIGNIRAVASSDGARIAANSQSGEIRVFSARGRLQVSLRGPSTPPRQFEFSPDGRSLLSCSFDGIVLWDLDGAEDLRRPELPRDPPYAWLTRDGVRRLALYADGTRSVLDVESGKETTIAARPGDKWGPHYGPRLSLDGSIVATPWIGKPPTIDVVATGERIELVGHDGAVNDVAISPDGSLVATAGADRTVRLWTRGGEPRAVLDGMPSEVARVEFSRDGRLLAAGGLDGVVTVFETNGARVAQWEFDGDVSCLEFSPDDRRLLVVSFRTRMVGVFEVRGALAWRRELRERGGQLQTGQWTSDGRHLLTVHVGGAVQVLTADGVLRATLRAPEGGMQRAAFSKDGTLIAAATDGSRVLLADLDGRIVATMNGHETGLRDVAFTSDGRHVVAAECDGSVRRWLVRSDELTALAARRATRTFTRNEADRYEAILGEDDSRRLRALRLIDSVRLDFWLIEEQIDAVTAKTEASDEDRRAAVVILRGRSEDVTALAIAAWDRVLDPGEKSDRVRQAVRWAEAAARASPDSDDYLSTLGACLFRAGRIDESIAQLRRADALARFANGDAGSIDAVEFLAMALAARGEVVEAEKYLAEAQVIAKRPMIPATTKKLVVEAQRRVAEAKSKR